MMAIDFAVASSEYIKIADAACFDGATGGADRAQSWSIWVRPDVVNINQWIYAKQLVTNEYYCYLSAANLLEAGFYDPGTAKYLGIQYAGAMTAGVWKNVIITYDGSEATTGVKLYVNGVSQGTPFKNAGYSGMQSDATSPLYLGSTSGAACWDGQLEDFRHFSRVLTPEEAAAIGAGYRQPMGEDCRLDMSLARGAFTGTLTQGTHILPDRSGNGRDGDPYNTPTMLPSDCPRMGVTV